MGTTVSKQQERQDEETTSRPKAESINQATATVDENKSLGNPNNEPFGLMSKPSGKIGHSSRKGSNGMRKGPSGSHHSSMPSQQSVHDEGGSSYVADDEVKVNLAMADLMAYLLVVANNSNNLPLTRRDDPEVGKTVSSLTADEYARKSAAFVPADVRIIGGSFTKYGRVWDLPTSEEYTAADGAQEPGRSYGGACCNAMLKVLYDAANEAAENSHDGGLGTGSNSLFDDDDDTTVGPAIPLERGRTNESLVLGDISSPLSITWADLLRKMKAEIVDIEYAQTPTLTSTRKFDINKPFSLIPDGFDPSKGQKRSLLIGCNYIDVAGAELKASHDDIRSMKDYIVNVHGFPEAKGLMTVLMDDDEHKSPTHMNITESLKALSEQSRPGDAVFIQFSGHGGRIIDSAIDEEAESYDEVIAPSDYEVSGLIRDTLIFKTLLAPMQHGVTVTILIDTCDTGMMLDLPYSWSTKTDRIETLAKLSLNDDFSFVRFLKVVKTLYEASTFTQLGRTVGSALKVSRDDAIMDEEDDTLGNDTHSSLDDIGGQKRTSATQSSFMNALTGCTSSDKFGNVAKSKKKKGDNGDNATVVTLDSRQTNTVATSKPTLLEQVMNCTLGTDAGAESDEDTYNPRYQDQSFGAETTTTFETYTDDGYESAPRSRKNQGKRR